MSKIHLVLLHNEATGSETAKVYTNDPAGWDAFHHDTFSPDVWVKWGTLFKLKTHKSISPKDYARNMARDVKDIISRADSGLTAGDITAIQNEMKRIGKRCGLLREFRESGII